MLVTVDEEQMQRALGNLIDNAVQFSPNNGVVEMKVGPIADAEGAGIEVSVRDYGAGIPDSNLSHIFEPFFSTKNNVNGTGLGLSVSYFIITHNHGGEMQVESSPGEGTRFIIDLPLEQTAGA